jgi:hypothetical protein
LPSLNMINGHNLPSDRPGSGNPLGNRENSRGIRKERCDLRNKLEPETNINN